MNSIALHKENIAGILVALCGATLAILTVLATEGNIGAGALVLMCLALVAVTVIRLDWSFYLLIGMVLLFDQFAIPGFSAFTHSVDYFNNLKENSLLPSFSIAVLNPVELHLVLLIIVWFVALGVKKLRIQKPPAWGLAALFSVWLIGGVVHGMSTGGDFLPALWEVRALFYLCVLYFLVPQIIQTKEQVYALLWVCIIAIAFKAFQAIERFVSLGFSFQGLPTLTSHEDPVFIVTLIIFLLALTFFGARVAQRTALLWLLIPLLIGFIAAQRRASFASGAIALAAFAVLLPSGVLWKFVKWLFPIAGVIVIYSVIFWNSESKWGSPVRLFKSGLSNEKEFAGERFYSNMYREFEKYNLAMTIRTAPVTGIGFGNKYERPIPLAQIPFPLRDYIPHNEILWVMTKLGAAGFFVFCFFLNAVVFRAASVSSRLDDPYLKAVCAVIVAAIANQLVVSYYDLQLTFYRNMVYLGMLMGLLPTLESFARKTILKPGPLS